MWEIVRNVWQQCTDLAAASAQQLAASVAGSSRSGSGSGSARGSKRTRWNGSCNVEHTVLYLLLQNGHLSARGLATFACVSRAFRLASEDDGLWHLAVIIQWPSLNCDQLEEQIRAAGGFRSFYHRVQPPSLPPSPPSTAATASASTSGSASVPAAPPSASISISGGELQLAFASNRVEETMADLTLCLDLLHAVRQGGGGGGGAGALVSAAASAAAASSAGGAGGGGAGAGGGGGSGGLAGGGLCMNVSAGRCLFSRRVRVLEDLEGMQPRPEVHVFRMEDVEVGAVLVEGRPSLSRRALERTAREIVASCVAIRRRDNRFAPFLHSRTPLTTTTVGNCIYGTYQATFCLPGIFQYALLTVDLIITVASRVRAVEPAPALVAAPPAPLALPPTPRPQPAPGTGTVAGANPLSVIGVAPAGLSAGPSAGPGTGTGPVNGSGSAPSPTTAGQTSTQALLTRPPIGNVHAHSHSHSHSQLHPCSSDHDRGNDNDNNNNNNNNNNDNNNNNNNNNNNTDHGNDNDNDTDNGRHENASARHGDRDREATTTTSNDNRHGEDVDEVENSNATRGTGMRGTTLSAPFSPRQAATAPQAHAHTQGILAVSDAATAGQVESSVNGASLLNMAAAGAVAALGGDGGEGGNGTGVAGERNDGATVLGYEHRHAFLFQGTQVEASPSDTVVVGQLQQGTSQGAGGGGGGVGGGGAQLLGEPWAEEYEGEYADGVEGEERRDRQGGGRESEEQILDGGSVMGGGAGGVVGTERGGEDAGSGVGRTGVEEEGLGFDEREGIGGMQVSVRQGRRRVTFNLTEGMVPHTATAITPPTATAPAPAYAITSAPATSGNGGGGSARERERRGRREREREAGRSESTSSRVAVGHTREGGRRVRGRMGSERLLVNGLEVRVTGGLLNGVLGNEVVNVGAAGVVAVEPGSGSGSVGAVRGEGTLLPHAGLGESDGTARMEGTAAHPTSLTLLPHHPHPHPHPHPSAGATATATASAAGGVSIVAPSRNGGGSSHGSGSGLQHALLQLHGPPAHPHAHTAHATTGITAAAAAAATDRAMQSRGVGGASSAPAFESVMEQQGGRERQVQEQQVVGSASRPGTSTGAGTGMGASVGATGAPLGTGSTEAVAAAAAAALAGYQGGGLITTNGPAHVHMNGFLPARVHRQQVNEGRHHHADGTHNDAVVLAIGAAGREAAGLDDQQQQLVQGAVDVAAAGPAPAGGVGVIPGDRAAVAAVGATGAAVPVPGTTEQQLVWDVVLGAIGFQVKVEFVQGDARRAKKTSAHWQELIWR